MQTYAEYPSPLGTLRAFFADESLCGLYFVGQKYDRALTRAERQLTLEQLERGYVEHVLERFGGNKKRAAEALGINRRTIQRWLGEDTGSLLTGTWAERDTAWHLARVDFDQGSLWLRDSGHPIGQGARLRVLARDVISPISVAFSALRSSGRFSQMTATPCCNWVSMVW